MKIYFIGVILSLAIFAAKAQDSVVHRVLLIGDAGEVNDEQKLIIDSAAARAISGKTTVFYLGDNIYPSGMALPGSENEAETARILQSQFFPMRKKQVQVYFIPGNHDWNRSKQGGLEKIKRQWKYLEEQGDSNVKLVPPNGCPDPVEIRLTDSLTIIGFDSEWWLYRYEKNNPDGNCACQTKDDVLDRFNELLLRNKEKVILLASHHPFKSYGAHGGHFTLKDHLFPLTAVNRHLYIPLPVVGSLYPLLRTIAASPQDMMNAAYKEMIARIDSVFSGHPDLVHVSGHEHGLQLIKDEKRLQVVSGSAAKLASTRKGKDSLFAKSSPGFVIADFLKGNALRLQYFVFSNGIFIQAFTHTKPFSGGN